MGCIAAGILGCLLVAFNGVMINISIGIFVFGVLLRYGAPIMLKALSGSLQITNNLAEKLHVGKLDDIDEVPLLSEVGLVLIILSIIMVSVSILGIVSGYTKIKLLLIAFIIITSAMTLVQFIMYGLVNDRDSIFHDNIKDELKGRLKENYVEADEENIFAVSINILQYLAECCGISGRGDFDKGKIPASCCNVKTRDSSPEQCIASQLNAALSTLNVTTPSTTSTTAKTTSEKPNDDDIYFKKGCYDALLDSLMGSAMSCLFILPCITLGEAVIAFLIIKCD